MQLDMTEYAEDLISRERERKRAMYEGETELLVKWVCMAGTAPNGGPTEGYEWVLPLPSLKAMIVCSRLYKSAAGARRAGCRAIKKLHPNWRIG